MMRYYGHWKRIAVEYQAQVSAEYQLRNCDALIYLVRESMVTVSSPTSFSRKLNDENE